MDAKDHIGKAYHLGKPTVDEDPKYPKGEPHDKPLHRNKAEPNKEATEKYPKEAADPVCPY